MKNSRIATCRGCQAKQSGLKSRIAIPHTCGLEPMSIRTKLFYALEYDEPIQETEPSINHKWGKWEKTEVPIQLRMCGVTYSAERTCKVCGATQHKTYYKGQQYPELKIQRNGREDVDCNPELQIEAKV